jgi:protein pelota
MIVKEAKGSHSNTFLVIPEDADDLFSLRRVIQQGDSVVADTTRVIKQIKEYARPDKGERVKVRISIRVSTLGLDDVVDRLRITGTITATDNELVPKGSSHSLTVRVGDAIVIEKDRKWHEGELRVLTKSSGGEGFILVAIDTQEAAVAKLTGTHVKIIPNIYSGQSGKRYQTKNNSNIQSFFSDIAKTIMSAKAEGDVIVIFGPGETKRRFYNLLSEVADGKVVVADGVDVAGEDGIFVFLRSPAIKQAMSSSKMAAVSRILEQVMIMAQRTEPKYAMGMQEVSKAASLRAIESVIFSDSIFRTADENDVVNLLNTIEAQGARTFAVDSSTDIGLQVSSLGGIVALLRYAMH